MTAFRTKIAGIEGVWPNPPVRWSYSALTEIEECPRRWALANATYAGLWNRRGYPPKPRPAAMTGRVVHRSAEAIVNAIAESECVGFRDPRSAVILRDLGGISGVIDTHCSSELDALQANPRATLMVDSVARYLKDHVPSMRAAVQLLLRNIERTSLPNKSRGSSGAQPPSELPLGTYAELAIEDEFMRLVGVVDLLEVTADGARITDFKSGLPEASHQDQVETYAVIWAYDHRRNPKGLLAQQLRLVYPSGPVEVGLDRAGIETRRASLRGRVEAAAAELDNATPQARPTLEACQYCTVRHLCDDYWNQGVNRLRPSPIDLEFVVEQIWTSTTARVATPETGETATLIGPISNFRESDRVRALELVKTIDDDTGEVRIRCGPRSELFGVEVP